MRCIYCNTEPNNTTTKKGLYVCSCYQLQKVDNEHIQYFKEGKEVHYVNKNGEYIEVD